MAILFDDASTEYLTVNSTPITAAPITMAAWANPDALPGSAMTVMGVEDKDVTTEMFELFVTGGNKIAMSANATSAASTTSIGTGSWSHVCGVSASATSRAAYLNGGGKGTDTTNVTPANLDRVSIGRRGISTPAFYFSGSLAEPAIWNIALSDAEVALLALGFSPLLVRPEALVFYLPMIALGSTTQLDWISGITMTETNTPVTAPHPPIFYPSSYTVGYGISAISSALSGALRFTGQMSATPLAANYGIYASGVPKRTFVSR